MPKKLKKEDRQVWKDNKVVYIEYYGLRILELVKKRNYYDLELLELG